MVGDAAPHSVLLFSLAPWSDEQYNNKYQCLKPLPLTAEHLLQSWMARQSHKELLLLSWENSWVCPTACYLCAWLKPMSRLEATELPSYGHSGYISGPSSVSYLDTCASCIPDIYKGIRRHTSATSLPQTLISTEKKEGMAVCSSTQWRALSLQSSQDTKGNTTLISSFTTAPWKNICNTC